MTAVEAAKIAEMAAAPMNVDGRDADEGSCRLALRLSGGGNQECADRGDSGQERAHGLLLISE
jgi:hypothetical protein